MGPQQNQSMPTFNLLNRSERQNTHQSSRFRQHLQTNLNIELGEINNEQSSDFSEKVLYDGNHSPVVTEEDLYKVFGFKTTSYLQKIWKVELFMCPRTGNSRCSDYVNVRYHIYESLNAIR